MYNYVGISLAQTEPMEESHSWFRLQLRGVHSLLHSTEEVSKGFGAVWRERIDVSEYSDYIVPPSVSERLSWETNVSLTKSSPAAWNIPGCICWIWSDTVKKNVQVAPSAETMWPSVLLIRQHQQKQNWDSGRVHPQLQQAWTVSWQQLRGLTFNWLDLKLRFCLSLLCSFS